MDKAGGIGPRDFDQSAIANVKQRAGMAPSVILSGRVAEVDYGGMARLEGCCVRLSNEYTARSLLFCMYFSIHFIVLPGTRQKW